MTTLVYRDGTLAADTMLVNGAAYGSISKIARHKKSGAIAGVSGQVSTCIPWLKEFEKKGFDPKKKQKDFGSADSAIVVMGDGAVWGVEGNEGYPFQFHSEFYVNGSGEEFALGALAMGASAYQAVLVASKFNPGQTNDVVETLNVNEISDIVLKK